MNLLERFRRANKLARTNEERQAIQKEFSKEQKRIAGLKAKEYLGTNYKETVKNLERTQKERAGSNYFQLAKANQEYAQSTSGKIGKGIETGLRLLPQGGVNRFLYRKSIAQNPYRRGRPKGTLDKRYAAYGGVYGYRKFMSQQRAIQRAQAQRNAMLTPEQQQILAQVQARDNAQKVNPERRVIPDTTGKIDLDSYMREIDDAANAVD